MKVALRRELSNSRLAAATDPAPSPPRAGGGGWLIPAALVALALLGAGLVLVASVAPRRGTVLVARRPEVLALSVALLAIGLFLFALGVG